MRMNEQIRIHELGANPEGSLEQSARGYFDLSGAADVANLRRLLLANIIRDVENVSAVWQSSDYRPLITETEVYPPRYIGDKIDFLWSRPVVRRENIADIRSEAVNALEAAVEAVVAAGFRIMEYPDQDTVKRATA